MRRATSNQGAHVVRCPMFCCNHRYYFCVFVTLLTFCAFACQPCSTPDDDPTHDAQVVGDADAWACIDDGQTEPNDTLSTATATQGIGYTARTLCSSPEDLDYYTFAGGGDIELAIVYERDRGEVLIDLLSAIGDNLAIGSIDLNGQPNRRRIIRMAWPEGEYFVRVRHIEGLPLHYDIEFTRP